MATHPSLAFDVVQLPLSALADTLRAPQLDADSQIRVHHDADGHKVRQQHERHVVAKRRKLRIV